ncbi:hypothetical protein ABU162_13240 [Paenibacillus thiaminolyticus]|uniref:hypothetical protein n=1 Tax=Paenibacillus thiaminolyticus TaxID=49283 RepID=UPI0035A643A5
MEFITANVRSLFYQSILIETIVRRTLLYNFMQKIEIKSRREIQFPLPICSTIIEISVTSWRVSRKPGMQREWFPGIRSITKSMRRQGTKRIKLEAGRERWKMEGARKMEDAVKSCVNTGISAHLADILLN